MSKFNILFIVGMVLMILAALGLYLFITNYGVHNPVVIFGSIIVFGILITVLVIVANKGMEADLKPKDIPNGLPEMATVIQSYQSGEALAEGSITTHFKLVIEALVKNPQGGTWRATIKQMLPVMQVGLFQPGVTFAVKYAHNDKSKVVIDQSQHRQIAF